MEASSKLTAITLRLEEYDYASTSLDLRGKGRQSNDNQSSPSVPRLKVRRFVTALKQFHIPPCIIKPYQRSNLTYLAIHNHLLDKCELPLLWDVCCRYMPQLEALCCRNHDVGDDGLDLLIKALMTNKARGDCSETQEEMGLKELYLSHCNISCKGATAIAKALEDSSSKLKNLQILSLGSNHIKEDGARALATAFGQYPPLQRLVLHGNKGVDSLPEVISNRDTKLEEDDKRRPIFHYAILPTGWQQPSILMTIFAPLILPHIQRRWEKDRVLVRPHDLLRKRLQEEMFKKDSTFVDDHLEIMPEIISWVGRDGSCDMQTSMHSQSFNLRGGRIMLCHSSACEHCQACATIRLNDVNELFLRMPHIVALLVQLFRLVE